jgi:hypothetical protein
VRGRIRDICGSGTIFQTNFTATPPVEVVSLEKHGTEEEAIRDAGRLSG